MHRRTFLKLAATTTLAAGARVAFPWGAAAATGEVAHAGALYRAAGPGKIETSVDVGRTWRRHSSFGEAYSITRLAVDRRTNQLFLTAGYRGRRFPLVLAPDKRQWLTS
jgi:hypothetical protein